MILIYLPNLNSLSIIDKKEEKSLVLIIKLFVQLVRSMSNLKRQR